MERDETCDDGGICLGGGNEGLKCPAVASVPDGVDCGAGTCTPVGGDGCAANCTTETSSTLTLDPLASGSTLQTVLFSLNIAFSGSQILQIGNPRDSAVGTPDEGKIPVAIRVADITLKPVRITGIACSCVTGKAVPAFGPGVAGSGQIGCGPNGLTEVNTDYSVTHVVSCTDPGATPDKLPAHAGLCNGAPVKTLSGGPAGTGSALITVSTSMGMILDGGGCNIETRTKVCVGGTNEGTACSTRATACLGGGTCVPAKGPDGIPCNGDDPAVSQGLANVVTQTTGTASASIVDANHQGALLADGSQCGTYPCVASVTGHKFDCSALPSSVSGSSTVSAYANLDQATVQDNVMTSTYAAQ